MFVELKVLPKMMASRIVQSPDSRSGRIMTFMKAATLNKAHLSVLYR